jgi:hypothetical protein
VVSWLIVIAIVAVSLSFSFFKYESVKQEIGLNETNGNLQHEAMPVETKVTADSTSINLFYAEKPLLENAIKVSDSILSFPSWKSIFSQGIEKRESFESKALSLRNRSMDVYRQIRAITPPNGGKQSYDSLLAAADNLRLAGYQVHYQFALEDTSGESIAKAREYANLAKSTISAIMKKE